jgi:hypothetical protein
LIKPSTSTAARARNEVMSKLFDDGAYAHQRLNLGTKGKTHGRNAKASNRTCEIRLSGIIGGPRETQPWWNCDPASQTERARTVTLHLPGRRARALSQPRGNGEQQLGGTYGVWRLPSTQPVPRTILHLSSIALQALQALLIDKHKTRCYHLFPNVSRSASRIGSSFHLLNCVCPDNPGCH